MYRSPINPSLGIFSGPAKSQRLYYKFNTQHTPPPTPVQTDQECKDDRSPVRDEAHRGSGDVSGRTATPKVERSSLGPIRAIGIPSMNRDTPKPPAVRGQLNAQARPFQSSIAMLPSKHLGRPPFSPRPRPPHAFFHQLHPPCPPDGSFFTMSNHASFTQEPYQLSHYQQGESNNGLAPSIFDHYAPSPVLPAGPHTPHQTQINPYAQDNTTQSGTSYYQDSSYTQPLQYHLYTALGPHREAMLPHQRNAQDFFISDTLREDLQRKSAAAHQVLPRKHK